MARSADDVLIGGGRAFLNNLDIGWLQGAMGIDEQKNSLAVKESEGSTVVVIDLDKEVHFKTNLLEANLDTLRMLDPSYTQVVYGQADVPVASEYIADLGAINALKHIPVAESGAFKVMPATLMSSPNISGDSEIYVENSRKFAVGDSVSIVRAATVEANTIKTVDSLTGKLTLDTPLLNPFPIGSLVKNTKSGKELKLGTDYNFFPALGTITRATTSLSTLEGDGCAVDYTYHSYKGRGYGSGSFSDSTPYKLEFWHKKRSGAFRCIRMFKAKVSGNFSPFAIDQGKESPIPIDVTLIADESIADTRRNIYEQIDYEASAAPGGGW